MSQSDSYSTKPSQSANEKIAGKRTPNKDLKFPSTLGQGKGDLHSYIEFKILDEAFTREDLQQGGMNFITSTITKAGAYATAAGKNAVGTASNTVGAILSESSNPVLKSAGQAAQNSGMSVLVESESTKQAQLALAQQQREAPIVKSKHRVQTDSTIRLFIPENIAMPTAAEYESAQLGTASAGLVAGAASIFSNDKGSVDVKSLGQGGNFKSSFQNEIVQTLGNGLGGSGGDVLNQAVFNRAANAAKYLLFKGINFRTFQFQYNLVPQSVEESVAIEDIIRRFRKAMLPDIVSIGFYDIPQAVQIRYYIKDSEGNDVPESRLHKFKPAFLTECNVSYGANGRFTLTKDGYPANIQLSLTFQENEQVTRTDVSTGEF